jgi:hypothetical protein
MTLADALMLAAYVCVLVILARSGWHRCYLRYLCMSNGDRDPKELP